MVISGYSPAQKVCNRRRHHSRQKMTAKSRRLATDATGCLAASRQANHPMPAVVCSLQYCGNHEAQSLVHVLKRLHAIAIKGKVMRFHYFAVSLALHLQLSKF